MNNRVISVRGIVIHEGKLLCVRLKPYRTSLIKNDFWCLPGGGLEAGESIIEGVKREMLEETGVPAKVGALLYVQQFAHDNLDFLEFFFHITNSEDYLEIDLTQASHAADEIEEAAFVSPEATPILPEFLMSDPLEEIAKRGETKIISRY